MDIVSWKTRKLNKWQFLRDDLQHGVWAFSVTSQSITLACTVDGPLTLAWLCNILTDHLGNRDHWVMQMLPILTHLVSNMKKKITFVNTVLSSSEKSKNWEAVKVVVMDMFPKILIFAWKLQFYHWQIQSVVLLDERALHLSFLRKCLPNVQLGTTTVRVPALLLSTTGLPRKQRLVPLATQSHSEQFPWRAASSLACSRSAFHVPLVSSHRRLFTASSRSFFFLTVWAQGEEYSDD